ncbi:MAG: Rieske (2Fe-2S) protein [Byssovorax sp.]
MHARRRFLKVVGASAAALAMPACGGVEGSGSGGGGGATSSSTSTGCGALPPGFPVGELSHFGVLGTYKINKTTILIGRDEAGLFALSSLCSHLGCDLNAKGTIDAASITCGCHGSKFDPTGHVIGGPATKPLKAYGLALGCDGQLYVDYPNEVPLDQRLDV